MVMVGGQVGVGVVVGVDSAELVSLQVSGVNGCGGGVPVGLDKVLQGLDVAVVFGGGVWLVGVDGESGVFDGMERGQESVDLQG